MSRTKKPTAAELKKIRLVKMIREVSGSGYSPDTWNPAEISDGLKQITYIRNLVDTWNPAQLNEAIKLLGFKTIDSWNPAIIDEMKTALIRMFLPKTVTGNPITLNLNGELPYQVQEAKVTFTPKQSGTGDPSPTNIRPINGRDSVDLVVSDGESESATYTATFPNTVYGGSYDFVSGLGQITYSENIKISDLTWTYLSSGLAFRADVSAKAYGKVNLYAECFKVVNSEISTMNNNEITGATNSNRVYIKSTDYTTVADFLTAYGNNNIMVEIATPTPFSIEPTPIELLKGTNVFSTGGDSLELKYQIDLS